MLGKLLSKLDKLRSTPSQPQSNSPTSSRHAAPSLPPKIPSTVPDPVPPGQANPMMYQTFEWYSPSDPHSNRSFWKELTTQLQYLKDLGVTMIWLPPGCKAGNPKGNGYDIYDLWDLGEFDWKGQQPTKWGSKDELVALCTKAKELGVGTIFDAVLSHRCAADESEEMKAVKVHEKDRTKEIGRPKDIAAWTKFDFPARNGMYSELKLRREHFNATDWDDKGREKAIFKLCDEKGVPKKWTEDVDKEYGNFDYLLGTNLVYTSPELRQDILNWGVWIVKELSLAGFRLDAIKHMSRSFILDFITHLQTTFGPDFFIVGEYWKSDSAFLTTILHKLQFRLHLYDVQLSYNFSDISIGKQKDLRRVLEGSLVELDAKHSVTIVGNHDTQPTQTMAQKWEPWFLPHSYAIQLLRACSSLPCVFHGHLHGIVGPEPQPPLNCLPNLMRVRQLYGYGTQYNYWDEVDCIGWTRIGRERCDKKEGCAVLLSSANEVKRRRMFIGKDKAGVVYMDVVGGAEFPEVEIGVDGYGTFGVKPRHAAVWIRKDEAERFE